MKKEENDILPRLCLLLSLSLSVCVCMCLIFRNQMASSISTLEH